MRISWRIIVIITLTISLYMPAKADSNVASSWDFTDFGGGSVEDWLEDKGFELKSDADSERKVRLEASQDGLLIEAKRKARALLFYESSDIEGFGNIRITWKVDRFPEGAHWEGGARFEPIMVMVFFGHERISSGHLMIPDSPYFIGLFLCKEGLVGKAHIGRYFKEGGRYVCLDKPNEGEFVTSEFDLIDGFKTFFEANEVPAVTGIALQVDTTPSKTDGKSMATVKSVEILKRD